MNDFLMFLLYILVIIICFFFGFLIGYAYGYKASDDEQDEEFDQTQKLHCFECEWDMPVKEKNGRLYCSNCGLYH